VSVYPAEALIDSHGAQYVAHLRMGIGHPELDSLSCQLFLEPGQHARP